MKKNMFVFATVAFTTLGAAIAPVYAQQFQTLNSNSSATYVQVQQRGNDQRGFERRGDDGYYNGQRGSRERRPGYREQNGYWFPPEAFGAGVIGGIIGGVLGSQNNNQNSGQSYDNRDYDNRGRERREEPRGRRGDTMRLTQQHVDWCEDRYRSYRSSDNTFQPNSGRRQECVSPFS